ncbi:trans-aconitate methyltransferase [Actinopolyspora erythraea]|uniref:Trans-aconitate methyltransferase n=1 Tax=Actinopolyspora erythraea TaxID=414996 RepID=A0A099D334_9ACTN|nr:trans-aconitate 2-methyltransferase [Actinopolyspora erythraea]ASU77985.1 trans-aconitate methyltransferase [Actinopolyspora erythraea]KGI79750.1 trans-aconitate methyltransferase [Actinopolyspora erythraea]
MWDPETYLAFAEQRERPMRDLLARMSPVRARRVVDLGCGAGNLTPLLRGRWPDAEVEALDSSPEMVRAAVAAGVPAEVADVRDWSPRADTDVVACNAVLHWVPGHLELLRGWLPALPSGACFGAQLPGNFEAPAHRALHELVAEPRWRAELGDVPRDPDRVASPGEYAAALADLEVELDVWETTYLHRLRGEDPVLAWLAGTALRPVRDLLDEAGWQRFLGELAPRLRSAYPPRADGSTWFPFRRIFLVAHRH